MTISERSPKAMSFADIRNSKIKTDRSSIAFVHAQPGLVDLSALQQIESDDQARAIARALVQLQTLAARSPNKTLRQLLDELDRELDQFGLGLLSNVSHELTRPRLFEIGAAANRLRNVEMRQVSSAVQPKVKRSKTE